MPFHIKRSRSIAGLLVLLFWIALSALDSKPVRAGTALGDLAASLQPGQWVQLQTSGANVMLKANGGNILEYSNHGVWDPAGKRAYFCGASHHGSFYNDCVRYDEATNSWSSIGVPTGICKDNCAPDGQVTLTHGYSHNAFDSKRGHLYLRKFNSRGVWRYDTRSASWSNLPDMPETYCTPQIGGLNFFPDSDRLVFLNGRCFGEAFYFNPASMEWVNTQTPTKMMSSGDDYLQSTYSRSGFIYGCGLSGNLARVNAQMVWEKLPNIPGCYDSATLFTADPATGVPLVFAGTIYELKANWVDTRIAAKFSSGESAIIVPIQDYGVIMLVKALATQVEVWLYKHTVSPSTPVITDTTPPSVPANVSALSASSSQNSISWSPSTDDVGVASYVLERCQGSACTNFAQIAASTAVSYSDTGLTSNTIYRYRVRARDAASNLSGYSAVVSATTQSASGGTDFQTRCAAPGVIKCVGFDSSAELAGRYGSISGILPGPGNSATIDTATKASGSGSLKFFVPKGNNGSYSGAYFTNFSDDFLTQFGENSEFYVQFRVRMTPEYINSGNYKVIIIGTGDKPGCTPLQTATGKCYASCTAPDVVVQTSYNWYKYPTMYNSCSGSVSHGPYDSFTQSFGSDYKTQNARPEPFCLYSQTVAQKQFSPTGNCFGYFPNEWMTFQIRLKTGPRVGNEFTNSFVNLWMAREGRPSEPVISWGPYNLSAGAPSDDEKYGKLWLLPYTGSATFISDSYIWYDELIVSRAKIPDPTPGPSATQAPAAPSGLSLR